MYTEKDNDSSVGSEGQPGDGKWAVQNGDLGREGGAGDILLASHDGHLSRALRIARVSLPFIKS